MDLRELAMILKNVHFNSKSGKVINVHLFVIRYGGDIENGRETGEFTISELVEKSTIPNYSGVINEILKLRKYVKLEYKGKLPV